MLMAPPTRDTHQSECRSGIWDSSTSTCVQRQASRPVAQDAARSDPACR
jgi:hypothetical protein